MPPVSASRPAAFVVALAAALLPAARVRADALPPLECVEALRAARIAGMGGDAAGAGRRAEAALALPGCELPALVELLGLVQAGHYSPENAPALCRRLVARLRDPAAAVPGGTISYLARLRITPEQDDQMLAALEQRRARAEAAGSPLTGDELREALAATLELQERLDRPEAARATVDRLLALEDREEWRWRALLLDGRLGRWESAERLLATMMQAPGASAELARFHVVVLARLGRYDEMLREIDRLAPAAPAGAPPPEGAPAPLVAAPPTPLGPAPALQQAQDESASFAWILRDAGWALRDAGHDTEAESMFRRALALEPADEESHLVLLHFYGSAGERAAHAAAVAERRENLQDPDVLYQEGTALLAAGDAAGARELLARAAPALAGTTFADAAWYNLGLAAFRLERWREAADAFAQAARLDDTRADTHFQRGIALFRLERCAEAIAPLRRALELAPAKFQAHYFLGHCYAALGQAEAAAREQELYRRAAPPR